MDTPKTVRFPATRDLYGPQNRQVVVHIDESALGEVAGAGIDTSSSFLEFQVSVTTSQGFSAAALGFKESGAPMLIRDLRVKSRQSSTIIDEVANYNLLWDLLFRTCYNDAQRETLGRMLGAQPENSPRTVFTPLPLTSFNTNDPATFTARIPLTCLGGVFRSTAVPLSMTRGLTLELSLEDRLAACFSASTAFPGLGTPDRFLGSAVNKTTGATEYLPVGGGATTATIKSAFEGVARARVVTYTATGGPRLYDIPYDNTTDSTPPQIKFGIADVGAQDNLTGAIIEPRLNEFMVTLGAQDDSAAAGKVFASLLNFTLETNPIRNGAIVVVVMDTISAAGVAAREQYANEVVSSVVNAGGKIQYTLKNNLEAKNYNGGGYILDTGTTTSSDPGNFASYSVSNVGIVVTPVAVPKLAPEMSWVSTTSWVRPISAGNSTLTWPTLPYSKAMAAIARVWTTDATAAYGTGNGISDFEYVLNGESTVHGGPISFAQHSPQWRVELMAALESSDWKMVRSSSINDALAVSLMPRGTMSVDTTMSVLQLRVSGAAAAANAALFVFHLRTLSSSGGMPLVTLD